MKNRLLKTIVLIVVIAIPVIYSFFYLKAYWDPYGNLQDIKIAMVNLDKGFEGNNYGNELISSMNDSGVFDICEVGENDGDTGLKNGEYYAEIKIPENFSENLYSAKTEEKQISEIIYSPNQKSNYLASQIINSALKTVELKIQSKVSEKVTENLAEKLNEVPGSLDKISDGTEKLLEGSNTLSSGIRAVDDGAIELKNGMDKAYSGSLEIEERVSNSIKNLENNTSDALDETMLESIGLQAGNNALDSINSKADEIGAMAANLAGNKILENADYIGNSAENVASMQILQKKELIGDEAADLASMQISQYMQDKADEIGNMAQSEALQKLDNQISAISDNVSTRALSNLESQKDQIYAIAVSSIDAEKEENINKLIEMQIKADPNFVNIPEAVQPYVLEYAKASAISTAKVVAGETAVATAETITENVAAEVTKQVATQVTSSVSKEVAMNVAVQTSDEVAKQVANQTAKTVAGKVAGEVANQTAQLVASQVAGEVANETAQTVAGQVAEEVANQTAQTVAGEVGNRVKEQAVTSVVEQMKLLENGLNQLNNGLNQIDNGTENLESGTSKLYKGSQDLVFGVDTLKKSVDQGNNSTKKELRKLNGIADFTSNPIEFIEKDYGKIEEYGLSFTPLFISIGLWVGSLMLYVVLYYDQEKRYKYLSKGAKKTYLQMAMYFGLAAMQGIATGFILKTALNFEVTNIVLYYFTCVLTAVTFLSIIQCLIMNLGDVGKFLALIILVLQLAASGGTFPVETVSKGFQILNPYLPMTYTIKLIKECVIMKDSGFAFNNIIILLLYLLITLIITIIAEYFRREHRKENSSIDELKLKQA